MIKDIHIPDISDFKKGAIVEISVKPGDRIAKGDTILMLESDKATMEIPAPCAGTVADLGRRVTLIDARARLWAGPA